MFLIKRFQGDEPNIRCHERVCLVTNTQRAGEGCRSQVSLFCLCVGRLPWQQRRDQRLSFGGDFGQMDRCSMHTPCLMLDMTVNHAFDFAWCCLFILTTDTTVFLEVTVVAKNYILCAEC